MTTKEIILSKLIDNKPKLLNFGIKEIGLFGSYRRNEAKETSDIDILIDFESGKANLENYMEAYDLLEEVFKPEKIEVVTKNGLSPYIGPHILKDVQYV